MILNRIHADNHRYGMQIAQEREGEKQCFQPGRVNLCPGRPTLPPTSLDTLSLGFQTLERCHSSPRGELVGGRDSIHTVVPCPHPYPSPFLCHHLDLCLLAGANVDDTRHCTGLHTCTSVLGCLVSKFDFAVDTPFLEDSATLTGLTSTSPCRSLVT